MVDVRPRTLLVLGLLIILAGTGSARSEVRIEAEKATERVSVRAVDAPLDLVIAEVARKLGAELRGRPRLAGPITTSFSAEDVAEVLRRLLGDQSFTIVYRGDGRARRIELLGGASALPEAQLTGVAPSVATNRVTSRDESSDVQRPALEYEIQVGDRLTRILGTPMPSLDAVARAARSLPRASQRVDAIRAVARAVDRNPTLRDEAYAFLGAAGDEALLTSIRLAAGDRTGRLLERIARDTSDRALRERIDALRARLGASDGSAAVDDRM